MQKTFLEFGSTSIKFFLLETSGTNAGRIQDQVKIPWELGLEVFQGRPISETTIAFCISSLERLQTRFPHLPLHGAVTVGTAALREAVNAEELQSALERKFGLKFHIIQGGLEAYFLESGFKESVESYPTVVFDLGGGSVELVEFQSPTLTRKISLPVGAIRLQCELSGIEQRTTYVRVGRKRLETAFPPRVHEYSSHEILGTGGTVRAVAQVLGRNRFGLEDVEFLLSDEKSIERSGLQPHRKRLLLPGVLIIERLFKTLGLRRVVYREATIKHAVTS